MKKKEKIKQRRRNPRAKPLLESDVIKMHKRRYKFLKIHGVLSAKYKANVAMAKKFMEERERAKKDGALLGGDDRLWGGEPIYMGLDKEEERANAVFMTAKPKQTLATVAMAKIRQLMTLSEGGKGGEIKPEYIQIYSKLAELLRYSTHGELPKAFLFLPNLSYWEPLLYLTRPDRWTNYVTTKVTKLFLHEATSKQTVRRFYNIILLPKFREEIQETGKLGFHMTLTLNRALRFHPILFYLAIVIPLCASGDCTLREATIMGSIFEHATKKKPRLDHLCSELCKLCKIPYCGANQFFIQRLLSEEVDFPFYVVEAVYTYFMNFTEEKRELPTMWHQTLLSFAKRCKGSLKKAHKEGLLALTLKHQHPTITPEVRREVLAARPRDAKRAPKGMWVYDGIRNY